MHLQPRYNESGYIRLFRFYGVDLINHNGQLQGECPFLVCRAEHHVTPTHFFANPNTGCWDCKKCGKSGNAYDFIRLFYEDCLSDTTDEDYEFLSQYRPGISSSTLKTFGVAYNYLNNEVLLPAFSQQRNKLINLYAWKQQATLEGPIMTVMSGPTFKNVMFGLDKVTKNKNLPLWVCEGPWDMMALYEAFRLLGRHDDVIGNPGTTIPDEDLPLLANRHVIICGDNDEAGRQFVPKTCNKLGKHGLFPQSLKEIHFPPGSQIGFDIRDLIVEKGINQAVDYLEKHQSPIKLDLVKAASSNYNPDAKPVPCEVFDEVADCAKKEGLFLPECLYDTLSIMMAVACTVQLKSHMLWAYIVGPPSSGKTTLLSLIYANQTHCHAMTNWTGLISGYNQDKQGDASLLPKLKDKVVTIEDLTPILNEPKPTQDRLFGELRAAYQGELAKYFRNREHRLFKDFRFHIIACVTDKIRSINNTDLGERFFHVEQDTYWASNGLLVRNGVDRKELSRTASKSVLDEIAESKDQTTFRETKSLAWGFMDHVITRIANDKPWVQTKVKSFNETDMAEYIYNLSVWTAHARSIVQRDRDKQLMYRPRVEYSTRLEKVLTKLAIALSLVFDESFPSERIKSMVRKVALDSGISFQQEIMTHLAHSQFGLSVNDLARLMNISSSHVLNHLKDMQELNIVTYSVPSLRRPGNQPHLYTLTPEIKQVSKDLGFVNMSIPKAPERKLRI